MTAVVASPPATPADDFHVSVPSREGATRTIEGWAPRPDAALPSVGDECLCAIDENGNYWAVAWASS